MDKEIAALEEEYGRVTDALRAEADTLLLPIREKERIAYNDYRTRLDEILRKIYQEGK